MRRHRALAGGDVHPFYRAILNRAQVLGYGTPSKACQRLQNTSVKDLVSVGIWDLLDIFYMNSNDVATDDFHRINWKDPALFTKTKVSTPVYTVKQGVKASATGYYNTGWTPTTHGVNFTINSNFFFCYHFNNVANAGLTMGSANTANTASVSLRKNLSGTPSIFFCNNSGEFSSVGGSVYNGGYGVQRNNSGSVDIYMNGSLMTNASPASAGSVNQAIIECGRRNSAGAFVNAETNVINSCLAFGAPINQNTFGNLIINYITAVQLLP